MAGREPEPTLDSISFAIEDYKCPILTAVNWGWFGLRLSYWQPCPVKAWFNFCVGKCDTLHRLTYRGKTTGLSSKPARWSADTWFGQLLIHLHTDGLYNWQASVNICARSNVTLDIGLHVVGVRTVGVRTLRHNQIFSDGLFTKFAYPWCFALCARESYAKMKRVKTDKPRMVVFSGLIQPH